MGGSIEIALLDPLLFGEIQGWSWSRFLVGMFGVKMYSYFLEGC